jgi:type I restriction enzyme S subunit
VIKAVENNKQINGTLPIGWEIAQVKDVCDIIRGVSYKKIDSIQEAQKGYLPILRATNIQNNSLVLDKDLVYVPSNQVSENQRLKIGDIVIATSSGSKHLVGKTAQVKEKWYGAFGAFCAAIRPTVEIEYRYLGYFFNSPAYKNVIAAKAIGVNINNLRRGDIEELQIPIAPINEQKRIVAEIEKQFSRLDEAVCNLKRVKANLKRYKASVLKAAVGGKLTEKWRAENPDVEPASELLERIETARDKWIETEIRKRNNEAKRLKTKLKKHQFKTPVKIELPQHWTWASFLLISQIVVDCHNKTAPYEASGIPLVRTSNVRDGKLNLQGVKYVSQKTYAYWSRRCPPEPGDILFTREAPMGEATIIPQDMKVCMGQRMMLIRLFDHIINTKYLLYSIMSPPFQNRLGSGAVGTGVKHLRVGDVEALALPVPPIEEQNEIVKLADEKLSIAEEIEMELEKNIRRSDALHHSILQKSFSGKLVPQDVRDEPAGRLLDRIKAERDKQKEEFRKKRKKGKKTMKAKGKLKEKRDILAVLKESEGPMRPEDLFRMAGYRPEEVEDFYADLKMADQQKTVFQVKKKNGEVFLRAV